jgi:hypothetical protein
LLTSDLHLFELFSQLLLERLLHCLTLLLNLLLHKVVGLLLEVFLDLFAESFTLGLRYALHLVLLVLHLLLETFLRSLLLGHTGLTASDLFIDLLLLREATNYQMTSFAAGKQVLRDPLEQGIDHSWLVCLWKDLGRNWQVVLVEDFVRSIRDRGDCNHQPVLIREVLLRQVDARLDVVLLEVRHELLDQDHLRGRFHADSENDLSLRHREDFVLLHGKQLLLRHVLAREVRQVLPMPC